MNVAVIIICSFLQFMFDIMSNIYKRFGIEIYLMYWSMMLRSQTFVLAKYQAFLILNFKNKFCPKVLSNVIEMYQCAFQVRHAC